MTTSAAELSELRDSMRKALRTPPVDASPQLDPQWREHWPALAALGVTAFCVAEDAAGFGSEVPAAVVASRELGAVLHGSPYAATAAAAFALSRWLDRELRSDALAGLAAGVELVTLARLDPGASLPGGASETVHVHVDGTARLVAGADDADAYLLLASDAPTMVYVRRDDRCVVSNVETFDVTRSCADVTFEGVSGAVLRCGPSECELTARLYGLLLASDALGGVERMLERTTTYAAERVAFDRPIGGFQAVQHRLVDHALQLRAMSLLVTAAAGSLLEAPDGVRRGLLAEAAVSRHALPILHDLVQLTGAIGFTWDYGLHLYERRAHLDARLARNPRHALASIAIAEGWSVNRPERSSR